MLSGLSSIVLSVFHRLLVVNFSPYLVCCFVSQCGGAWLFPVSVGAFYLPLTCWSGIYGGTQCRLGCGIYCHISTHILSHYDGPLPFPILSPLRCTFLFPLPLALPRAPYLRSFSATGAQSVWRCVPVRENESFASGRFPHLFRLSHLFFPCFFFFLLEVSRCRIAYFCYV